MPSEYLQLTEAAAFGLSNVSEGQIQSASAIIDAYLKRPEGLIWSPDAQGLPCYMVALSPTFSFKLSGAIAAGAGVNVTLTGPTQMLQVGDVAVIDRKNTGKCEAVVCSSVVGPNGAIQITLQNVLNAHDDQATVELGLVIEEQKYMPKQRPITMLSRAPTVRVISGIGRYGYGRRGDAANYNMDQFNLVAALQKFGGPPAWELFQQPLSNNWDVNSGQLWIPAGIMLAYYSEVKVRYVAGFPGGAIPMAIKVACVQIIQSMASMPQIGNLKSYKAGDTQIELAAASALSADNKEALQQYAAKMYV
jgi:hypothetical protein